MTVALLALLAIASAAILFLLLREGSFRASTVAAAQREAQAQLEAWRERELQGLHTQDLELARGEAKVLLEQWKLDFERSVRQDAVRKSQVVTFGKVTEHFIPYLPDFPYNPKDARFLGSPIDFVVFDGLNEGDVRSVVFVEVKTGTSALSTRERRVRDAVEAGRVQWRALRHDVELADAALPPAAVAAEQLVLGRPSCRECGAATVPNARFCAECGADLVESLST